MRLAAALNVIQAFFASGFRFPFIVFPIAIKTKPMIIAGITDIIPVKITPIPFNIIPIFEIKYQRNIAVPTTIKLFPANFFIPISLMSMFVSLLLNH